MKTSATERRKYPRSKPDPGMALVCTAAEPSATPDRNLAGKIIDVSAIGACVVTPERLREGMPIHVEIVLPGTRGRYKTNGRVKWTQFLESRGREAHVAGLEFDTVVDALVGQAADSSILDILLTVRVAVAQLRLYPKESPQVLKVVTDTYHSIHSFLETAAALTLSKTPKGLLINGRPLPISGTVTDSLENAMLGLLTDAQVKSISFKKGLTLDELISFLHALTKKFWDVKDGKEINRRLREERVLQVSVDEVQYVALGEGDIVIEDAARKLRGGNTEIAKLLANLDQLIEAASEEGLDSEGRLHIMKRLLDKDPNLLKEIGQGDGGGSSLPLPNAAGEASPTGGVVGSLESEDGRLSFEDGRKMIGEASRLIAELPEGAREPVRRLGKMVIQCFRHNPRLMAMMGALLEGQAQANPEGAPKPEIPSAEPAAVLRASALLALGDDEKIQTLAQEGAALLDELSALERPDLVSSLLDTLSAYMGDRSAKRRLAACRALNSLRRAQERNASDEVLRALEVGIRSALDQERDPVVYPAIADLAAFLADLRIRRGGLERAREILDLLHKHYKIKDAAFVKRGELAYVAMERLASGGGLASLGPKVRIGDDEACRIVEALGAAATRFLIGEIKSAENSATRLHLAQFIARAGPGAATVLLDEIQKTTVPSDVLRLIEVLPHSMPIDMAEMALGTLLRHQAVAVRKRTAQMVTEQAYPRAGGALADALKTEEDPGTRMVYIESLGRLRHKAAFDLLTEIVDSRNQSDELRSAACLALGRLGDVRAVTVLAKLCIRGDKGLTRIFRLVSAQVRAAAVRALALYPANRDAQEALRRAQDDGDPMVRSVASQARYSPILEAFGDLAQGVTLVSSIAQITSEALKVGGSLGDASLDKVCRSIARSEKMGLLSLNFNGPVAKIYFDAGLVIAAEFEGRRDKEAFQALAHRKEGFFLFQPGESAPERRILVTIDSLFEEAVKARSSSSRIPGPDPSARPSG
jgi:HEAT repeat protein